MAKKIEIGTELDMQDWIALNDYLNDDSKQVNKAALDCLKLANKMKRV